MITENSEIQRLDEMGQDAANAARHQNYAMNHGGRHNQMARHAAMGSAALMPMTARLAIPVLLFLVFCLVLSFGFGVEKPGGFALAAVIVVEAALYLLKRRRLSRLREQAIELQPQLHDLKEQEFALRYEQAKANGDLDRFNTPEKP
jgi:hypothetical protein